MEEIEFENNIREHRIINRETKTTKIIAVSALLFIVLLTFISYTFDSNRNIDNTGKNIIKLSKTTEQISLSNSSNNKIDFKAIEQDKTKRIETTFTILNIFIILLMIGILAIKKTIYYSSKLIKENDSLEQVLRQWKKIDISLLIVSYIFPITGLIITIIGIEFKRTTHFFITSFLLVFMLMPMGIKIRSRLKILKNYFTNIL